jgi:hypothetical protein
MIAPGGTYYAPSEVPLPAVTVTVRSAADTLTGDDASVDVLDGDGSYVSVAPAEISVPVSDSTEFAADVVGCGGDEVTWSLEVVYGDPLESGEIRSDGTYLAPARPGDDFALMIMGRSASCPEKTGLARVVVKAPVSFFVELEDFTESFGTNIRKGVACGGGEGVTGLDSPGEWIRVPVDVHAAAHYAGYLRYAAGDGDVLTLTVSAESCGPGGLSPSAEFSLDDGTGVGG